MTLQFPRLYAFGAQLRYHLSTFARRQKRGENAAAAAGTVLMLSTPR